MALKYNLRIILKFSIIDIKRRFKASIFSWIWLLVSPLLLLFVYWFGLGSSTDSVKVDGVDYYSVVQYTTNGVAHTYNWISWILIGIFTWSYCGDLIISGPTATSSYAWMCKSFGISPYVPPFIVNLSRTIIGVPWILLAWIISIIFAANDPSSFNSDPITWYALEVPVIIILTIIALNTYSYALSSLSSISKDFRTLIGIFPGLLAWITGVFIQPTPGSLANDGGFKSILIQINPFNFILNGMRSTMMGYGELFTPNNYIAWYSILSFFLFFVIVFVAGIFINKNARKFLVDIM